MESASDGASALVLAQTNMPDLVLSDVMMPGLDGFGLLAGLRADPNIQTIPILLLSARAGEEARLEGLQAGADAYLVKPFSARELIATVNAQLGSARLRQQLTELQAQLLESAEASIKMRDEFISVAAHELKTPLTSLRGFVQLLMRQLSKRGTIEPGQLQRALTTLDSQSTKLIELLNQLLDLSRLEAGRLALSRRKTDLCRLLSDVIETVQRTTVTHTISLSGPQSCHAWVDPIRLEQVLVNLLNNAIKYSPEGGPVEVTLDCPDPSRAQISVRDHGLGVPVGRREHLFERFYQAHGTGYLGGMGLGLYISRQIVELHDGVIRAEFPEGNGTRFVVSLPLEQPVMEVN